MQNLDKLPTQRWQKDATRAVRHGHYRFGYLCENFGVTKAVLARQVRKLRHNEQWIRTTSLGQQRCEPHVKAMHETITSARGIGKAARS